MIRFGRCMSKIEANEIRMKGRLFDSESALVPVFDCPESVERRLRGMTRDQLSNFFRDIGVRSPQAVVFFDTTKIPDGTVGPIPQKNGLREYKLPVETPIDNYDRIRI